MSPVTNASSSDSFDLVAGGNSLRPDPPTPERIQLRSEVQLLSTELQTTKLAAENVVQQVQSDAAQKARAMLDEHKRDFKLVAQKYEETARDICKKEVATI